MRKLSEYERQRLAEADAEIEAGNFVSWEEVEVMLRKRVARLKAKAEKRGTHVEKIHRPAIVAS